MPNLLGIETSIYKTISNISYTNIKPKAQQGCPSLKLSKD